MFSRFVLLFPVSTLKRASAKGKQGSDLVVFRIRNARRHLSDDLKLADESEFLSGRLHASCWMYMSYRANCSPLRDDTKPVFLPASAINQNLRPHQCSSGHQ